MTGSTRIGIKAKNVFNARSIERQAWPMRALLGFCTGAVTVMLTWAVGPLRIFPLLLGLPVVILAFWFLDAWGGVVCALTEAVLVEIFLTSSQTRFILGQPGARLRMPLFIVISISLGWTLRMLSQQKTELSRQELERRLLIADGERRLAEERAHATQALRDRDEMLQIALNANGMGLWVWDLQYERVYWSDAMYRMAGHEPGSIDPSFEAWTDLIHPEDRARVVEARRPYGRRGAHHARGWSAGGRNSAPASGRGHAAR